MVRQRKLGVEGLLLPPEKKPNLAQLLGLGLLCCCCCCLLSDRVDSGSRVQNALLQPVLISTLSNHLPLSLSLSLFSAFSFLLSIPFYSFLFIYRSAERKKEEEKGDRDKKKEFCLL